MVDKVIDPTRIVTDTLVLKELTRQKIDKDFVEFIQDYAPRKLGKEHNPYAKFYRDLKSNKLFMVVSGLPMVKPNGQKIEVGWRKQGSKYISKANLFSAEVNGTQVRLTCLSDQPTGEKENNTVAFSPQLFLNGIEVSCGKPSLLATDPLNPNYQSNVLEWDYGVCKRRLRIVEGRIHGHWVFTQSPNGEVRIKYNQSQPRLKLSDYAINDDEELITATELAQAKYPLQVGDSATFYPDADPEDTSVDGMTQHYHYPGTSWATIRAGPGTGANPSATTFEVIEIAGIDESPPDYWYNLFRSIYLFDTSGLPDTATITEAVLSIWITYKTDPASWAGDINIYASNPASNTDVVPADFGSFGSTAFSTALAYGDISVDGYNSFTLNASGRAAIDETGVSKFGTRNANYDVANIEPSAPVGTQGLIVTGRSAEYGTGCKPKLVVTYTLPPPAIKPSANMGAKMIGHKMV